MLKNLCAAILTLAIATPAIADDHVGKAIENIQIDARPCVFFTLRNVPVADAAVTSGGPWFAIPKSAANFAEMNALIMSAKLAGRPMTIRTNGSLGCGFAVAVQMNLDP